MMSGATNGPGSSGDSVTPDVLNDIITEPCGGMTMLPSRPFDEVYKNIFIGEESIARSPAGLKRLGVTHLINMAEGVHDGYHVHLDTELYRPANIQYLGIEATDDPTFDLSKSFQKCADYIASAIADGGKVLVSCKVGTSRSATIVLAYLIIKCRIPAPEAVKIVRKRREICPNDGFLKQLCELNSELLNSGHFETKEDNVNL
ncbi:dual specificity protein phosphatase 3-like isoform X2 [Dreissena polymorpha]|uniref:Dual specificity protein phosphatase n=3 Tax=Dreissena polymorpha TaxID=45954 RepID=A0A9D4N5Z1_DREPO|nr:dual specificity protein phosphatase 3-like isoform X2 [Dreissena polymorpha]XP_052231578.1 dual specificity protein phosphatase 3-like isoform X2 [Dreissena polymorpha]KAH3887874.1 hypothetical protein DPMN_011896 [Dreissena polymorpha]